MSFTGRPLSRNDRGSSQTYKRKFNISAHAIERYRERVDDEFRCRDDQDLGNLLDEKLQHPESKQTIRDSKAPDDVTQLFEIVSRTGTNYFVVMRDMTAVTVLDPSMVNLNFAEGTWKHAMNTPFVTDALKKVQHDMQAAGAKKLTPLEQAVARGDKPPPRRDEIALAAHGTAPAYSPLELAGLAHARALKKCRDVDRALERTRREIAQLEAEQIEANDEREAAQAKLTELVESAP